ncbi:hypothetical protein H5P28_11765 [Ruficoccus amylovorans]|uniref:Uncharacterized protein n=1 Tax=Ruficoccus amylovorans TaxID=1804625 RepID=A0A842HH97_9BACT|nr:hypothetical protein [Ruficoccus amylovorans]MBC2594934.1 hypothetical protein [Ruficoccus amylovorans]
METQIKAAVQWWSGYLRHHAHAKADGRRIDRESLRAFEDSLSRRLPGFLRLRGWERAISSSGYAESHRVLVWQENPCPILAAALLDAGMVVKEDTDDDPFVCVRMHISPRRVSVQHDDSPAEIIWAPTPRTDEFFDDRDCADEVRRFCEYLEIEGISLRSNCLELQEQVAAWRRKAFALEGKVEP